MSITYPHRGLSAIAAILCLVGCEAAKSANPTAPSVAGPIPGVNITAPRPLEPYAGSTITFDGEPQTLLIENAGTSGSRTLYLQLEVGTDTAFRQLVHQADQIALGANGRTTYRMPAPLGAGYTYYWRTRAADGANVGPARRRQTFSGATGRPRCAGRRQSDRQADHQRPDFRVNNGAISRHGGRRLPLRGLERASSRRWWRS